MTGKPVFAASEREKVLFPDPAIPVTRTRRLIPKAASLIDSQCPSRGLSATGPNRGRLQPISSLPPPTVEDVPSAPYGFPRTGGDRGSRRHLFSTESRYCLLASASQRGLHLARGSLVGMAGADRVDASCDGGGRLSDPRPRVPLVRSFHGDRLARSGRSAIPGCSWDRSGSFRHNRHPVLAALPIIAASMGCRLGNQ